ncbi:MAG: hypothetical protein JNK14_16335 [Chitinophagaceae bacterium]|nr:hypothetical protein [Chitinophagaceae bacterium]
MKQSIPGYLLFDSEAKRQFSVLTKNFGYKLVETITKPNYVRHTYRNRWRRRKVVIENQTFPVDYGFGFFVYNLWTKEHLILYNIPWDKEDAECVFLSRVKDRIFNSDYLKNIIKGRTWKIKKDDFIYE